MWWIRVTQETQRAEMAEIGCAESVVSDLADERARAEKAEAALSIEREASAIALRAEQMQRITAEARADRYLAAMRELVECPSTVDEATIPTRGIDAAPHQVVLNVSVSLAKLRNIRALVEEARRG